MENETFGIHAVTVLIMFVVLGGSQIVALMTARVRSYSEESLNVQTALMLFIFTAIGVILAMVGGAIYGPVLPIGWLMANMVVPIVLMGLFVQWYFRRK